MILQTLEFRFFFFTSSVVIDDDDREIGKGLAPAEFYRKDIMDIANLYNIQCEQISRIFFFYIF